MACKKSHERGRRASGGTIIRPDRLEVSLSQEPTLSQEAAVPFDFTVPEADPELSTRMQRRVRTVLSGCRPRPTDRPAGWHPLAALRRALSFRRRPWPDKPDRLW